MKECKDCGAQGTLVPLKYQINIGGFAFVVYNTVVVCPECCIKRLGSVLANGGLVMKPKRKQETGQKEEANGLLS